MKSRIDETQEQAIASYIGNIEKLVNPNTGEVKKLMPQYVPIEARYRPGFAIVYPDFFRFIITNRDASDVLCYLVMQMKKDNKVKETTKQIAKALDMSERSVQAKMKTIKDKNIIKVNKRIIFVNPYFIAKCSAKDWKELANEYITL